MPTSNLDLQNITSLRQQRDQSDQQVYSSALQLQKLQAQLTMAQQTDPQQVAGLRQQVDQAQQGLAGSRTTLATAKQQLQTAIQGLYQQEGPQQLAGSWSDALPIALFPVRIETRFQTGGVVGRSVQPSELWVRVYPDEIVIDNFEKTLTDAEVAAGSTYWITLFNAIKSAAADAEDLKKAAWANMVKAFGSGRAAWVAMQTKPTNWTNDDSGIANASQLIFPAFPVTKTQAWSQAARTNLLPDRFVVMAYVGSSLVQQVVGNLIPDELIVGPDPLDPDNGFVDTGNGLGFGPDFNWASDFDQAVALGMGFRIPLKGDQVTTGFDRILVLGLCLSRTDMESQEALEDLIDAHHYGPEGFSLLPQGSPTKNTDQESSAFSSADPFASLSYFVEAGNPLFTADTDCDGRNLADGLGIDYGPLQYIAHTDNTDYQDAVLMNQALYPGTLGYYVGTLLQPVLDSSSQAYLADFFSRWVTGRGPLPAFRVGKQPYGVLLTSDFSAWTWQKGLEAYPDAFLQTLYAVLKDYWSVWQGLESQLAYAGKAGQDPGATLLNILGLQPGSASFFQRTAYSTDNLYNLAAFEYGGQYYADMQNQFVSKNQGLAWLQSFGYNVTDSNGLLQVPQILRLVYQHFTTALDPTNLVDNIPLSETNPIHYYDTAAEVNYLNWLASTLSITDLEQQNFGSGINPPNQLLYLMLRKALLQALHAGSVSWFSANGLDFSDTAAVLNFHNIRPGGTLTKWEVMKAPLSTAVPGHAQPFMPVSEWLLGPGKSDTGAAQVTAMRTALAQLAGTPSAALARCFTEHIDCLTYRLDSWLTAMFAIRLQQLRNSPAPPQAQHPPAPAQPQSPPAPAQARQGRSQGIWLGAYGWVENVTPAARQQVQPSQLPSQLQPTDGSPVYTYADNGGYVQAPSINHASAAAVLRSGFLSHADAASPGMLSVNLSSERVRRALLILEGIREGQSIEVLLGYQFEQGLHDQGLANPALIKLNEYIYDFRDAYPVNLTIVQQQATTPQETIPANDVVNGLALSQSTLPFPYGATGPVTTASTAETAAIELEKGRLSDSLDAAKDLLTVESVYQLVLGNYDRAGAVLNSLQNATAPPVLDSIDTPRGAQFGFINRVTIQLANGDPNQQVTNPWYPIPMTGRASLETGLNKWLATILGNPNNLVMQVAKQDAQGNLSGQQTLSLDQLRIQPIDLVYMLGGGMSTGSARPGQENSTGSSELETRVAYLFRSLNNLTDADLVNIQFLQPQGQPGKTPLGLLLPLIQQLKSLATDSRYLNAQDFNTPTQQGVADPNNPGGYDTGELQTRVNTALSAFQTLLGTLQAIPITATITDSQGNTTNYTRLGDLCTAMDNANIDFTDLTVGLTNADATTLQGQLLAIANFGMGTAFPQLLVLTTDTARDQILTQAKSAIDTMITSNQQSQNLLTQAAAATDPTKQTQLLIQAGQAFMGTVFNIIPQFAYNNNGDIQQSHVDETQLLQYASGSAGMPFPVDEWMQNAAEVRPRLARWDEIRMLAEARNTSLDLSPVQLPYKQKDSWLAVPFPSTDGIDPTKPFGIDQDTLSVVIHGIQAFVNGPQAGLLIDEWTEHIPTDSETTGITFNYEQPNSFPPQALLLAVPPVVKGNWDWNEIIGILTDTLERAKLRAVEPQMLATTGKVETAVLLPALLSNFTQADLDLALDYRINLNIVAQEHPVLSAAEYNNN